MAEARYTSTTTEKFDRLRRRAEAKLLKLDEDVSGSLPQEVGELLHELRTHQIELEMQNDELLRTQLELITTRDRYSELFDSAPVGYVTIDSTGMIVEANLTVARMLGRERPSLIGQPISQFIHEDDQAFYYRHRHQVFEVHAPRTFDARLQKAEGGFFWAKVNCVPVVDDDGSVRQCRAAIADISLRRQVEEDRKRLIAALERKNGELERFAYTISHDLKSALITIRGFLGVLKQDLDAGNIESTSDCLERITAASDKMEQMLNELLQLSRVGHVLEPMRDVRLNDVVADAVGLLRGEITHKGVQIEIPPDLPTVYCDHMRLVEVIQNLISNAIKYMGDQAEPRILVGMQRKGDEIACFVRDNGMGVEPEHRDRIFGLFDKLDPKSEGTGIGLCLAKTIIEAHGGRIWVESKGVGTGSIFLFTLPPKQSGPPP